MMLGRKTAKKGVCQLRTTTLTGGEWDWGALLEEGRWVRDLTEVKGWASQTRLAERTAHSKGRWRTDLWERAVCWQCLRASELQMGSERWRALCKQREGCELWVGWSAGSEPCYHQSKGGKGRARTPVSGEGYRFRTREGAPLHGVAASVVFRKDIRFSECFEDCTDRLR